MTGKMVAGMQGAFKHLNKILFFLLTIRRCLCELAKQIGFVDKAQDLFQLQQQLSTFRHVVSMLDMSFQ